MNSEIFERIIMTQMDRCLQSLNQKGDEYSNSQDRLHNFKIAASFLQTTPAKALLGMLSKHLVSISDMINNPDKEYSEQMWDEKITDSINYLLLLRALIDDYPKKSKDHIEKSVE